MSRIIKDNYFDKLNAHIEEFEQSTNLSSLVNFFIEEVQKDQNRKGSRNQKVFSANNLVKLNEIKGSEELRRIFAYTNIIFKSFTGQYLHIHINADLSENLVDNLITLFAWEGIVGSSYCKDLLLNETNYLNKKIDPNLILPSNNNQHIINQIYRERFGLKHRLKFIAQINSLSENTVNNGLLLNLNTSAGNSVHLSEFSEFPESLNSYVNFGDTLRNTFKKLGENKVLRLSTIVNLFPSITGQNIWYKDFIRDEISRYNNFKKVITITSGEKKPEALLEMQKQNKFQAEEIYTIFSFEL
jgi:hypothetical protein